MAGAILDGKKLAEAVRRKYAKLGLNPSEVKKFRAGNLLFVLHDPNGQLVEFTQYWPGSLHAEDRGKHLGSRRASDHLRAASTPVKDVDAARVFYVDKLGFTDSGSTPTGLRLPGNSGDELELQLAATSTKSQIGFAVGDVKQTADLLRKRGLTPRMEPGAVMVNDPDRTLIVFGDTSSTQKP